MRFHTEADAITYIFRSMRKRRGQPKLPDEQTRDIAPTKRLALALDAFSRPREYAVVTGSKGKGSTTVITAKLLQHLGHRVGLITSPHLVSWRERIRVDGRAISEADLCRILDEIAPEIDVIEETLGEDRYFSPQGIFLAVALRWFDEQGVTAAVLEVGRGGRFDDISVVPNKLALFTPIMLEHPEQLGPTVERIAWHKSGIIKPLGFAYSVPQQPSVLDVLQAEADAQNAEFNWIAPKDIGVYRRTTAAGQVMELGRYGEVTLSLLGRFQIPNATLAVIAAGNMHARLKGVPHGSDEYVECIRAGLADVRWPGRCTRLQDHPLVIVDGAINAESGQSFVESVREQLRPPVITIACVPDDKDYAGLYAAVSPISQTLVLTETARNPTLHFLSPQQAIAAASAYHTDVHYAPTLGEAVEAARARAGSDGTIMIVGTQSIVAETMLLWGQQFEVI